MNEIVGQICQDCVFSCHKRTCNRHWNEKSYPMEKYGTDEECPMLQFEAIKPSSRKKVTMSDVWKVCKECKYSKKDGPLELGEGFEEHCMDCTCNQIRESLVESGAEYF